MLRITFLLLVPSTWSSNTTEPVELHLPRFLEETFPLLSSRTFPGGFSPSESDPLHATTRDGAFVTPLPDTETSTLPSEEGAFTYAGEDAYEELFKEFGDVIGADEAAIKVSESRDAGVFRLPASEQEYEYDYDTGYEVDIAEPRSSGYEAPQESYGKPQESYSSYEHHDDGYKVQPKKPGPYGYETPNFKCEKSSETLYVTETEWTFDKKCYMVYKVQCSDGYDTGKGIGYQKHCNEFTVTRCRTVFDTSSEERCWTVYKKKCEMVYETMVDWEYEQKCTTSYEEECHGYGYHQECEKVPKEHCKQVPKKVEKQVPRTKCKKVPDKRCQDFPINVPRKECKEFPKTVCTQDPVNIAKKIPKKTCVQIPREVCNKIPRQIIKEVPKKVGKKVCSSTKQSYGHATPSYEAPPSYSAPAEDYGAPASTSYGAPPSTGYGAAPSSGYQAPPSTGYGAPSGHGHRRSSKRSPQRLSQENVGGGRGGPAGGVPSDNWGLGPG